MATAEVAMVALLKADGTVGGFVGTRIYPNVIPANVSRPAISYQRIDTVDENTHSGYAGMTTTRIQWTLEGTTYDNARLLAAAFKTVVRNYRGTSAGVKIGGCTIETDQDGYSETVEVPVVRLDTLVVHDGA